MNKEMINSILLEQFAADVRKAKQQTGLKTIRELYTQFGASGPFKHFARPIQTGKVTQNEFIETMEQIAMSGIFD